MREQAQSIRATTPVRNLTQCYDRGFGATMRKLILIVVMFLSTILSAQQYDLVIAHGRVMDPETGLDAVRNVAIENGKIARISSDPLSGKHVIDAAGLEVAPGFIDLHQHGQDLESQRVKAFDGVTTALEMEIGAPDVADFLKMKQGHSLINYGTTASHVAARALVFGAPLKPESLDFKTGIPEILPKSGPATDQPATSDQIQKIQDRIVHELHAGALGVGLGIQYTPGATRLEIIDMFRLAAEHKLPVYTHLRSFGQTEPGSAIESVEEVIGAAAISGAALHIVHINSTCLMMSMECISLIDGARARGLDVTTEAYPYIAGMTILNSAQFNPGWREKLGIDYGNLVLLGTGEHLTKERFEALHNSTTPDSVLVFANTPEIVDRVITNPLTMIASDGAPGHPRNAGTYSRVLAEYVREKKTLTLMEALRKMTLMPAQMLERSTPEARRKGRLQEGADADMVVFDPQTIQDRATFEKPMEPSVGVRYLLVGGTVLIDQGQLVSGVYPGRAIVRSQK
jgi:cytosine/adenosine deaminase-related metal-dependent hydrolase